MTHNEQRLLACAVNYLEAVEVESGRYAFFHQVEQRWFTFTRGLEGNRGTATAHDPVAMPSWWEPDRRTAWRWTSYFVKGDERSQHFYSDGEATAWAREHAPHLLQRDSMAHRMCVTAALDTGIEQVVPIEQSFRVSPLHSPTSGPLL